MIHEEQSLREELEQLSPTLAQLQTKDDGFRVPPGFFDQHAAELFSRLETPPPHPIRYLSFKRIASAAATVAMLIVAGIWWHNSTAILNKSNTMFTALSEAEVAHYLEEHVDEFDADWMLEEDIVLSDGDWLPGSMTEADETQLLEVLVEDLEAYELEDLF
jgi:hypothetical protein